MKKLLITLAVSLCFMGAGFAQETSASEMAVRGGANINIQPVMGDFADYVSLNIGGGASAEIDLPISLPDWIKIGVPVNLGANVSIPKTDMIQSMWNFQLSSGIYARFLMMDGSLIIQPELDYGMAGYFITPTDYYSDTINSFYLDQMFQFSLNVRYAPKNILDGKMEFSIAPVYALSPEMDEMAHYFGVRLGIFYKLM